MYKPPPSDDQREYHNATYPRQRRRSTPTPASIPKRPQKTYYSDEHPEIPKIKRASLRFDLPEDSLTSLPTPQIEQDQSGYSDEEEDVPQVPTFQRSTNNRRNTSNTNNKVTTTPRRPPHTHQHQHQPPPAAHRSQRKRAPRSFLAHLRHWSYNPAFMITISLLVAIVILGAIVLAAVHSLAPVAANIGTTPAPGTPIATSTSTGTGLRQPPTDPHTLVITPEDTDHPPPTVFATAAYLLDADTGATVYAYNPFMHLPVLSTTKLMTAALAIEHGNLDQKVTITAAMLNDISKQVSSDATVFGFNKGETYTLRDLMYTLLLLSANDAAIVIADDLSGNVPKFVAQMNQRAQELGLYDTHFVNPNGLLDTGHYSCAHDLALLGRYSMSLPALHTISGTKIYHLPPSNHPDRYVLNGNQFLWWYPGVDGGKPGYDGANNFVQVISVTRNHHHLIGVTIHTNDWWTDMRDLMNWGFDSFTWISPHDVDQQQAIVFDYAYNYFTSDKKENTVPTADKGRYYIYTGFSISGLVMGYFDKMGGLGKFGFPTGMPQFPSASAVTQQFEHAAISCALTSKQCKRM